MGLYAVSVSGGSPIKITDKGQQIYEGIYGGWETLAAAEIDGVNTVLWKHKAANRLHTWRLDSNWEHISSDGWIDPNSGDAIAFETNFNLDLNGDSFIGQSLKVKESEGSVDLLTGTNGLAFAVDNSDNTYSITWNGKQIGDRTWLDLSIVAAEIISERNQFVTQHAISGDLRIFSADSNWEGQSNTHLPYNSTDYLTAENSFGIDFNNNGTIGS